MAPVRVLIVDDHDLFAKTLQAVLAGDQRIEVIGRASNGGEAIRMATALTPAVVLMDLDMPIMDGFEATRRLIDLELGISVVILTASDAPDDADRALAAGAIGYVTKDSVVAGLGGAILDVALGRGGDASAAPLH